MKTMIGLGLTLAMAWIMLGDVAMADNPWRDYNKHMNRYYRHMENASEEAAEGDWEDSHEEARKAQANYNAAQMEKPGTPVVVVPPPRHSPRVVIYRPYR